MLKFKISHTSEKTLSYCEVIPDSIVLEGETIEEIQEKAKIEIEKRNWVLENCWSEKID